MLIVHMLCIAPSAWREYRKTVITASRLVRPYQSSTFANYMLDNRFQKNPRISVRPVVFMSGQSRNDEAPGYKAGRRTRPQSSAQQFY
jgi:hypothetical protein